MTDLIKMDQIVTPEFPVDPLELLGEKSFGKPQNVPVEEVGTPIQEFFRNASILITGGTGFMGKTLTEKLLRSCPHLKRIYLIVRTKKGKFGQDRLDDILSDRLFLRLKTEVPNFRNKISIIHGDLMSLDLGISSSDRATLIENVNIVFHGAATVRFDEKFRIAAQINILGVRAMLEMAKEMKQLKSFVHVSTAFTHCPRRDIDEMFYETDIHYKDFLEKVKQETDEELERQTDKILGKWPNSYTLSKAMAEDLIRTEAGDLPLSIFRPSVIVSTYKEPVRGWIDNPYGPVGMMIGVGTGVLHTTLNNNEGVLDIVPIDIAVNCMLAIAWYKASSNQKSIPIYNYVSSSQNPILLGEFSSRNELHADTWPAIESVWYLSYYATKHRLLYLILNFFLHRIPGYLLDVYLKMTGRKPRLTKIYNKLSNAMETLAFFSLRQWEWKDNNVQNLWNQLNSKDKELYFFSMKELNWNYYIEALDLGLRVYLLKDDIHTLPAARRKWKKLFIAHCFTKYCFFTFILWIILEALRYTLSSLPNFGLIIICIGMGHIISYIRESNVLDFKLKQD